MAGVVIFLLLIATAWLTIGLLVALFGLHECLKEGEFTVRDLGLCLLMLLLGVPFLIHLLCEFLGNKMQGDRVIWKRKAKDA